MKRSTIIVVGMLVLGLGVYSTGQETDLPTSFLHPLVHEAGELERQGMIEAALEAYQKLQTLEPGKAKWVQDQIDRLNTRVAHAHKANQVPGRFQLIGESGWVYRIDTATGEVLGMSVGNQDWVRVGEKIVDKLPITVETN